MRHTMQYHAEKEGKRTLPRAAPAPRTRSDRPRRCSQRRKCWCREDTSRSRSRRPRPRRCEGEKCREKVLEIAPISTTHHCVHETDCTVALNLPAAQVAHEAAEVPAEASAVPTKHAVHADDEAAAQAPLAHAVHIDAPKSEPVAEPAAHERQAATEVPPTAALYSPEVHAEQALALDAAQPPATHWVHEVAPLKIHRMGGDVRWQIIHM